MLHISRLGNGPDAYSIQSIFPFSLWQVAEDRSCERRLDKGRRLQPVGGGAGRFIPIFGRQPAGTKGAKHTFPSFALQDVREALVHLQVRIRSVPLSRPRSLDLLEKSHTEKIAAEPTHDSGLSVCARVRARKAHDAVTECNSSGWTRTRARRRWTRAAGCRAPRASRASGAARSRPRPALAAGQIETTWVSSIRRQRFRHDTAGR